MAVMLAVLKAITAAASEVETSFLHFLGSAFRQKSTCLVTFHNLEENEGTKESTCIMFPALSFQLAIYRKGFMRYMEGIESSVRAIDGFQG